MPTRPAAQYRFGDFKLLPAERLLFRRGSELALTARAFEVLVAFVERAGQLLGKDELLKQVWAGLVVEENNLAVQVGVLRKLLGAEAITTIPGYGYRFALDVIDVGSDGTTEPGPGGRRGPGNLPLRLPTLIGRQAELHEAAALLQAHPLLTLCGGPGFGKTRLAQELALRQREAFADGAWWVDLTLLREGEAPALLVARTLGIGLGEDDAPLTLLTRRLAQAVMLIVLDNAEHRADDVAALAAALVRDTAHTRLIVTSQVPLHGADERLLRLAPLPLADAVRLLAERAGQAAWGDAATGAAVDEAVAEAGRQAAAICSELDGNPLAIELAASRIDALGLGGLAARLQQRLTLLAPGGAVRPSRRNALAAAMAWSHDLLTERERWVLRRLAVFPGSFSLEGAALALGGGALSAARVVETVLSLVDRSLVSVERGPPRRFRLLETTRLFALDRLQAAGETEAAWAGFCAGLRWLFEDAYEESWRMPPADWHARYGPETTALWAALGWAAAHDVEAAAGLFGASSPLWRQLPAATPARALARALADRVTDTLQPHTRARFWLASALAHSMVHPGLARAAAERAATLYRGLADTRGEYLALVEYAFNWRVDGEQARAALARAKGLENPAWPAAVIERGLTSEAVLHMTAGRHDEARRCYTQALAVSERGGFDRGVQKALVNLADLERAAGRVDEAVRLGEMLRARMRDEEDSDSLVTALGNLLGALIEQGRDEAARSVALQCWRRVGRWVLFDSAWLWLDTLALLHLRDGRAAVAARLAGASDRAFELHSQPHRQPNEAADRAALDRGLARCLAAAEIERLQAEGRRMAAADAITLAFDLAPPTVAG